EQLPLQLLLADIVLEAAEQRSKLGENSLSPVSISGRQLAYVIYTSGSTGQPKGVMVEQQGMLNHLYAKIRDLELQANDLVAQTASQCFDISVWQMLAPLLVGCQVCIYSDEIAHDPALLLAALEHDGISILEVVPLFLRALLEQKELQKRDRPLLSRLRWVIPTGEALPAQLCRDWFHLYPDIPLLNAYGPTECSDDVSHYKIAATSQEVQGNMPLGRPVGNLRLYVLDQYMQPVPVGLIGEIYVGGMGVGRGYRGEVERTAEAFVPDPFDAEPGARLYKTGDRGRYQRDGNIEWIGRIDQQIKVRGYRVELEEIEVALNQHPAVQECVIEAQASVDGSSALAAFVVLRAGQLPTTGVLQEYLRRRLPDYMVPAAFLFLEHMPLLANGKVDRRALHNMGGPCLPLDNTEFVAARNPLEELVTAIWVQVLNVKQVSIHDDFFVLGGHSLLATRIVARIRDTFSLELSLRTFFALPTVAQQSDYIRTAQQEKQALSLPPLKASLSREHAPLSYAQQRQWFLDRLDPDSRFAAIFGAVRLYGPLQREALQQSLWIVVQRHEALRTTFTVIGGEPVQVIAPDLRLPLSIIDLQTLPLDEREPEVWRLCSREKGHPYDLEHGPLLRVTLLCLGPEEHILLLSSHHIVFDGWSNDLFLQELARCYLAFTRHEPSPFPALPIQYADYARWQRQWLRGDVLDTLLAYWRQQLVNLPVLTLPIDNARPALWEADAARIPVVLSAQLTASLKEMSQREGVTLFMFLLATYQCILARYSGQQDIVVGSPIANRRWAELEGMIGCFMNTLVLRADLSGNPSFRSLLGQIREMTLGAYTHQDLPFEKLVEELQPERDLKRNPLFQALFALQNEPQESISLPDLQASFLPMEGESTLFDLDLTLWEEEGIDGSKLVGGFKYCKALFHEVTIQRIKEDWLALLELIVADPTQRIGDLPLFSSIEQQRLLMEWNSTETEYARDQCIHELFEAQVVRTPDAPAVIYGETLLTYRQLNAQANQLAHHLRNLGVCPGVSVAIYMERSLEMIPALLGILKAGGTYVPLEIGFPTARISWILTSLKIPILLTQSPLLPTVGEMTTLSLEHILCLDAASVLAQPEHLMQSRLWTRADLARLSVENLPARGDPGNLAYIIFTSGSTGTPKGVMVCHRPVINLIEWVNRTFAISSTDRALFITSLCFDLSVYDIFGLLAAGGSIQIVPEADLKEPEILLHMLVNEPVTFWDSAPAALQQLVPFFSLQAKPEALLASKLRLVFLSGDWIPVSLPDTVRARFPGAELVSLGGATEATIWSNFYRIKEVAPHWASIPYGKPIQNAQYYVLDATLHPCPPGVPGDLYIGGECLASGYAGDQELTAQKFIPDPFAKVPGRVLYKTGDRARFWQDGNIEFLGRIDSQVKIRGFRVETGEIEATLARHPAVQMAIVEARASSAQITSEKRLIAYVVARVGQTASPRELRLFLRKQLPAYMVPSAFIVLDELPVTANGKVDRRRLPAPDIQRDTLQAEAYIAPATPDEEKMASIWCDLLRQPRISTNDNFFEIGGHSLLAVQLITRVREAWRIDLPLRSLFEAPSIAELTARVAQHVLLTP
ncbi:MAG TPA: amino acid adenylation domain-containing protein, partial [Ktedonobacteraceae bacterium]|nr:amino acid adenylation domain-containing protein [Ktedonobacteraceae bacterium]